MFLNLICPNLLVSEKQLKEINLLLENNPNILHFNSVLKVSKIFSFLIFIMKEIVLHITSTTPDGISVSALRNHKARLNKFTQMKEYLNGLLS